MTFTCPDILQKNLPVTHVLAKDFFRELGIILPALLCLVFKTITLPTTGAWVGGFLPPNVPVGQHATPGDLLVGVQ